MLNAKVKKNAIARLQAASEGYEKIAKVVEMNVTGLLDDRLQSLIIVEEIEAFINVIANKPKEISEGIREIEIEKKEFRDILDIEFDSKKADTIAGGMAGAGIAAATGVAAFGPTVAMAIATTFGTASTGTPIAALTGAAASKAALAWLGGGALTAGGGGMVAGQTLLRLAGPVGWAIGGVALSGSMIYANSKNKKLAAEAEQKRVEIEKEVAVLKGVDLEIGQIRLQTETMFNGLVHEFSISKEQLGTDYTKYSKEDKLLIGTLVRNTASLAKYLNVKVGER